LGSSSIQNIISEGTSSSAIDLCMLSPSRLPDKVVMAEFFCTDYLDFQMQGKAEGATSVGFSKFACPAIKRIVIVKGNPHFRG
jgi:hypothetical protein